MLHLQLIFYIRLTPSTSLLYIAPASNLLTGINLFTCLIITAQKSKAIALTFRPFVATFCIFEEGAKNGKTLGLYTVNFLATFFIFENWQKHTLYPSIFRHFSILKKGQNSKAIVLIFRAFFSG